MKMEIRGLSKNTILVDNTIAKKNGSIPKQEPKDSIVISNEGRDLAKADLTPARLDEIRNKIKSNFYNSPEVWNKVADKILNEISK